MTYHDRQRPQGLAHAEKRERLDFLALATAEPGQPQYSYYEATLGPLLRKKNCY